MDNAKKFDVVALGELLIDFIPEGVSAQGKALLTRNAGGAPANVLAMLSLLGKKTAFIGKVGSDSFGLFLKNTLLNRGIDVSGLSVSRTEHTTLAFVTLDENGDRSFDFYRNNSADVMLKREEVPEELLKACRVFHFGSVSMTAEPSRDATLYAARRARELGKLVSYDPNYRPALWKDRETARSVMKAGLAFADVVKVSDEESEFLTGTADKLSAARELLAAGAKIVLVTAGADGTWYAAAAGQEGHVPSLPVNAVDTTGAGDTFLGAFLSRLLDMERPVEVLRGEELEELIRFANAAGALCTTGKGAIESMPRLEEIEQHLKKKKRFADRIRL